MNIGILCRIIDRNRIRKNSPAVVETQRRSVRMGDCDECTETSDRKQAMVEWEEVGGCPALSDHQYRTALRFFGSKEEETPERVFRCLLQLGAAVEQRAQEAWWIGSSWLEAKEGCGLVYRKTFKKRSGCVSDL